MRYAKFWAAVGTALAVSYPLVADGVSATDAIAIALAFLGALGVYAVPNAPMVPVAAVVAPPVAGE